MAPWVGKVAFFVGLLIFVAIRVPHDRRSKGMAISESRKGVLECLLLFLMTLGVIVLPGTYLLTPFLSFADHRFHWWMLVGGIVFLLATFWLFRRAHVDLGTNWSVTLELREDHALVTGGVYRSIRHPMYSAIFLYGIAQLLLLANWMAGPACLIAFVLMFAGRLGAEERMMHDRFGAAYEEYAARTKRLIPGVW